MGMRCLKDGRGNIKEMVQGQVAPEEGEWERNWLNGISYRGIIFKATLLIVYKLFDWCSVILFKLPP